MKERSPFAYGRFEKSGRPSYYLHGDIYQEVIRDAPATIYLIGPRGTGKTTLLKALHWRERLENPSLNAALNGDVFGSTAGPFIGVYLKLPEILLSVVESWLEPLDRDRAAKIVSLYLDLVWVQALCDAIAVLLANGSLNTSPERERTIVANIVQQFRRTFIRGGRHVPRTIAELGAVVFDLRGDIEQSAKVREPHEVVLALDAVGPIGIFGRYVGTALELLCRDGELTEPWHFRICMDEAETFSNFQLLVFNSMVRGAETPVFFVASFVSMPEEVHNTFFKDLSLQATDREIVSFEKLVTNKRFREFAEGVASVRIAGSLPDQVFDIYQTLGRLNINALLQRILERSVSPFAKSLLRRAEVLAEDARFSGLASDVGVEVAYALEDSDRETEVLDGDNDEGDPLADVQDLGEIETGALPVYQAFLIDELQIELPATDAPWQRRRQSSAQLRKRMVAAYLAICHRLSIDPQYASAQMVLGLSDACIRDFLRFIDHIYHQFGGSLGDFLTGPVPTDIQDFAIKEASKTKAQGIDGSGVTSPREVGMIVRGVGLATRILQTRSPQRQHLLSSERGIFTLPLRDSVSGRINDTYRRLTEAAEAGFLRLGETRDEIRFRIHASLAPAYKLSYRGAYYRSPVDWNDVELLSRAKTDAEVDVLADRFGRRLANIETLPLFPELDDA